MFNGLYFLYWADLFLFGLAFTFLGRFLLYILLEFLFPFWADLVFVWAHHFLVLIDSFFSWADYVFFCLGTLYF